MKKIIILILCLFCLEKVSATEVKDITNDIQIKYKWYQEEITKGFYHPKKEKLSEYIEDEKNIIYGNYSDWNSKYCNYSKENYLIEEKNIITYEKVARTQYIKIEFIKVAGKYCVDCLGEIKIFFEREEIEYEIISQSENHITIKLTKEYDTEKLWFYIEADHIYNMYLIKDINLPDINLSQFVKRTKILIPDKNWITNKTTYIKEKQEENLGTNDFIKNIEITKVCRVREINTYRYKLQKKYYDNNYYEYLENYLPDINNYIVYYQKEFPTNTIEITKTVEEPKYLKEYIYIETEQKSNEAEIKEDTKSNQKEQNKQSNQIIYQTKYIDKEVERIPTKIYLLLILLFITIFILSIKILKKRVD